MREERRHYLMNPLPQFSQFSKDPHSSLLHQVSSLNSLHLVHLIYLLSLFVVDEFEVPEEVHFEGEEKVELLEVETELTFLLERVSRLNALNRFS